MSERVFNIELLKEDFYNFVSTCNKCQSKEAQKTVKKAFRIAEQAFFGIKKNSDEYYIEHSVAVAKVVAQEIGLGVKSIVAAMLHDVLDETDLQLDEIRKHFGHKTANILSALNKIREVIDRQGVIQAEAFREVLLTLSDDIRVIFIKIADRLHHLRSLHLYTARVRERTVNEAMLVYVPLAHRLGLYNIKTELEDLSFKYKNPKIYNDISSKIIVSKNDRKKLIADFAFPIREALDSLGFKFEMSGRTKSVYSIWQKMQRKKISFDEIYDLFAMRIVFTPTSSEKEHEECWKIFKIIENMNDRLIKEDRIRDWLTRPKKNGYSALHLTVLYMQAYWIEIQIRTERMNDIAENGFASHWKYKGITDKESDLDLWIKEIKEKLKSDNDSSQAFFDTFHLNDFSTEILVFSSKGKVISLPKNATVLDFAFKINPDAALHCIGAKKIRRLVSRNHRLRSGDIIEILSSKNQKPQQEWLKFLVTDEAKSILKKHWLQERVINNEKGKKIADISENFTINFRNK